ncbi:MAG: HAD-IA family hydrolase [Clostridia bacterium]|nr:HAD-IA family hydrolase [Clostridia bacterium]
MYETVIFDLDGTLLDTLDDLASAVNAALKKYSLPCRKKEEVRAFIGNGARKLMERAVGEQSPLVDEALSEFYAYYQAHCKDDTKPYQGGLELLLRLKERGIKTAVLSNKPDFAVKLLAEEYFGGLLELAVGENEGAGIRKKPAPDALFLVLESLGVDKKSAVYVGDSEVDIQTAQAAGMDCICVTWGFKDKEFLAENGGKTFIDEPAQLLAYCKEK